MDGNRPAVAREGREVAAVHKTEGGEEEAVLRGVGAPSEGEGEEQKVVLR